VFYAPAALLLAMAAVELFLLRDKPGDAGFEDFDTADASSGEGDERVPVGIVLRRILTHPILLTVAAIEFCTGVLRNGVMHWFPIYAKEVWELPDTHPLRNGDWGSWELWIAVFALAAALFVGARFARGRRRVGLILAGAVFGLAPFLIDGGWGGLLFVAGVVGGNVAGWSSDLFFQSRRGPSAAFFYGLVGVCAAAMVFALAPAGGLSPFVLGALVFLMSLGVIGTHGLLSGTATMDFGGRKGAATAVGLIDGFVYLGTGLQSICLGYLTPISWTWWPIFLIPFAVVGFLLCLRIWHAMPNAVRRGAKTAPAAPGAAARPPQGG
jgi:OPA family glycerol-3-phosphate transporter-like MFS transporter